MMKSVPAMALCVIILNTSAAVQARPVSYPDGWTVMQQLNADKHSLHVHYSPTAKYSVGLKSEYVQDKEWRFYGMQLNYLVKRWNAPSEQANFYFKNAIGLAHSDFEAFDTKKQAATMSGIALDWETRRYFTSYDNNLTYAGDIEKAFMQKVRLGIAPYIGDYGDLHTWLMLEGSHKPGTDDSLTLTPLIRLFKGQYMAEAGMSDKGDILFNAIIRF